MRIKIGSGLLPLNILTALLIIMILFPLSSVLRIILGLPFVLFFSGYGLVLALFPKKEGMGGIERVALSFGLSIAVVPLIGLILNYSWWGITLESTLYSVASFIFLMSIIGWIRRKGLSEGERFNIEFNLTAPGWGGTAWDRVLSVVLVIAIMGALGILGYVIATPKVGEKFTEFYLLGPEGKAADYPRELKVGETGKVTVGIINREHQDMEYHVEIWSAEDLIGELGPVRLRHGQTYEREVNIFPVVAGNSQKLEFLLFRQGEDEPYRSLHLWIDIKPRE